MPADSCRQHSMHQLSGADPSAQASTRTAAWWFRYVAFQMIAVSVILLCLEGLAAVIGIQTLDVQHEKPPSDYPSAPDDYVKIAIFGGSAAAGTYSPRGLDDLLQHQLSDRFPDTPLYVKNYARHGEPFHRHQAEYAKRMVDKYDFMLIYCGNNEAENWYDDSGYWRQPEYKAAKDLVFSPPEDAARWPAMYPTRRWLRQHSRIFALTSSLRNRFEPPISKNRNRDYAEFEAQPSVPAGELTAIVENVAADLRQISELAETYGTQVLVSSTVTHELWPPSYSTFSATTNDQQKRVWHSHFALGTKHQTAGEHELAISSFEQAYAIDADVAILQYRLGRSLLAVGQANARDHLRRAIDLEGHYFRPHSELTDAVRKLADHTTNLHFVDVAAVVHEALQGPITDDDLFTDICHPSFLGYVIIADAFAQKLMQFPPLDMRDASADQLVSVNWEPLAAQRYAELKVTVEEDKVATAGNILYCFDLMHFTAYPDHCEAQIRRLMARMESLGPDDPMVGAFNAVCRARLAVRDAEIGKAVREINQALLMSPEDLEVILELKAWNHYIEDEFSDVGIEYSPEVREFVLRQ